VIDTPFHKKYPKNMKQRIELIPIGRIGEPMEVAKVVFLLGSELNTYITNEIITVSGGE
jgi:NAD(P)-dependent dehydrogenase (short-subunit alcohol dehydrogenase family)